MVPVLSIGVITVRLENAPTVLEPFKKRKTWNLTRVSRLPPSLVRV